MAFEIASLRRVGLEGGYFVSPPTWSDMHSAHASQARYPREAWSMFADAGVRVNPLASPIQMVSPFTEGIVTAAAASSDRPKKHRRAF
jgi:hypothetical protein